MRPSSSLFVCVAQCDGRAVEVEGDGRVCVAGVLNAVQSDGVYG